MKYLVIDLSDFSVLTEPMMDEAGELKVVKTFDCVTSAKLAAEKLALGVVVPARELHTPEEIQNLNQRIQDLLRENESLQEQLNEK